MPPIPKIAVDDYAGEWKLRADGNCLYLKIPYVHVDGQFFFVQRGLLAYLGHVTLSNAHRTQQVCHLDSMPAMLLQNYNAMPRMLLDMNLEATVKVLCNCCSACAANSNKQPTCPRHPPAPLACLLHANSCHTHLPGCVLTYSGLLQATATSKAHRYMAENFPCEFRQVAIKRRRTSLLCASFRATMHIIFRTRDQPTPAMLQDHSLLQMRRNNQHWKNQHAHEHRPDSHAEVLKLRDHAITSGKRRLELQREICRKIEEANGFKPQPFTFTYENSKGRKGKGSIRGTYQVVRGIIPSITDDLRIRVYKTDATGLTKEEYTEQVCHYHCLNVPIFTHDSRYRCMMCQTCEHS